MRFVAERCPIVSVQTHDPFCGEHGPVVVTVAVRRGAEVEVGVGGLQGAMSPDDALEIYDSKAMRFEREIAPSQVDACLPQIAHARAQHFSRREALRWEIREQD